MLSESTLASRCEYDYGMLATEYLIASVRDLRAPFWMLQRATSSSFETAFQQAYGIDFASFARDADAYVKAHYAMQL